MTHAIVRLDTMWYDFKATTWASEKFGPFAPKIRNINETTRWAYYTNSNHRLFYFYDDADAVIFALRWK